MAGGDDAQRLHDLANVRTAEANWSHDAEIWAVIYEWFNLGWVHLS